MATHSSISAGKIPFSWQEYWKSLAGDSSWGLKKSLDTTEVTKHGHYVLLIIYLKYNSWKKICKIFCFKESMVQIIPVNGSCEA